MSWHRLDHAGVGAMVASVAIGAGIAAAQSGYPATYDFGTPASADDIAAWDIAYPPTAPGCRQGAAPTTRASSCLRTTARHVTAMTSKATGGGGGGPALIGGRGTLNTNKPVMTVESYWPYATTLYDYIHRAMPFTAPDSLKPDEVYALVAYILGEANITDKTQVINADTLPKVQMPNRDGFFVDNRPMPVLPYSDPHLGADVPTHF